MCVCVGESAVGKSSLVLRFVKGQFYEYQESTIGAAFLTQTINYIDNSNNNNNNNNNNSNNNSNSNSNSNENVTVKFEIWDTAGQGIYI